MWQRIKNIYHLVNALFANIVYGFPSRRLSVIGVTGTDGKTTTTSLIYHILQGAGNNTSMISSVGAIIGGKEYDVGFHVTTPSPWALQKFLFQSSRSSPHSLNDSSKPSGNTQILDENKSASTAASLSDHHFKGTVKSSFREEARSSVSVPSSRFLVLETTSHAIDQNRIWGIPFDIGVLTNITHEHLDYHKTYENYVKTKAKLLQMARVAVVNRDDESFELVKSKVKSQKSKTQGKSKKFIAYGMKNNADINPQGFPFKTNMIGEFNEYNVLAAIAACKSLGIDDNAILKSILTFKPPIGREDIVYKNSFTVMIDFAHTPNAFEQILSSIKASVKGRIIHVFGSAGLRDSTKRPLMGRISSKYADIIILTSEDPRSESVEEIMNNIESGIKNHELGINFFKIIDRKEAIESAIEMAGRGDMVLITGKSHEKSMNYGKGEISWDEYGAVKRALKLRKIKL